MWGYPRLVLGALGSFLEPFFGHVLPKVNNFCSKLTFEIPPRRALGGEWWRNFLVVYLVVNGLGVGDHVGFGAQGSGFRVQSSGFRGQGSGLGIGFD